MNDLAIHINEVENGFTLRLSYEVNGKYEEDTYIATTTPKLMKMVKNALNMLNKEVNKNAD